MSDVVNIIRYRFPLRRGLVVKVQLPADLNRRDVERFKRWLDAQVFEEDANVVADPFPPAFVASDLIFPCPGCGRNSTRSVVASDASDTLMNDYCKECLTSVPSTGQCVTCKRTLPSGMLDDGKECSACMPF